MAQHMTYPGEYSMCASEKCVFCCCLKGMFCMSAKVHLVYHVKFDVSIWLSVWMLGQFIFDKGARKFQWRNYSLLNKWCIMHLESSHTVVYSLVLYFLFLTIIPLNGCTTFYLFSYQLKDIWVVFDGNK